MLVSVSCRFIALFMLVLQTQELLVVPLFLLSWLFTLLIVISCAYFSRWMFQCSWNCLFGAGTVGSQPCSSPRSEQKTPYVSATVP